MPAIERWRRRGATIIAWLDSDDLCHPLRLAVQFNYLRRHADIAMIGSAARKITADGTLMKAGRVPFTTHEEIRALLLFRSAFQQSSIFGRCRRDQGVPVRPRLSRCARTSTCLLASPNDFAPRTCRNFLIARRIHSGQTIRSNVERIIDRQMAISARKLARLGVTHDADDLRRHVLLGGSFDNQISDALIDWSECWFERILAANRQRKIYRRDGAEDRVRSHRHEGGAAAVASSSPTRVGRLARACRAPPRRPAVACQGCSHATLPVMGPAIRRRPARALKDHDRPRRIAFLYVGGVHHVSHTLPVAAALSRKRDDRGDGLLRRRRHRADDHAGAGRLSRRPRCGPPPAPLGHPRSAWQAKPCQAADVVEEPPPIHAVRRHRYRRMHLHRAQADGRQPAAVHLSAARCRRSRGFLRAALSPV